MMLLGACVIPLALHAAPQGQVDSYLKAVPSSCSLVLTLPDVADMVAYGGENAWIDVLTGDCLDEAWSETFGALLREAEESYDGDVGEMLALAFEEIAAISLYIPSEGDGADSILGIVLQVAGSHDGIDELLASRDGSEPVDVLEVEGLTIRIMGVEDSEDYEYSAAYFLGDACVVQASDDLDALIAHIEETIEALTDPQAAGIEADARFVEARDAGIGGAHIGLYLDLAGIIDELELDDSGFPALEEAIDDLRWCQVSAWLGPDEEFDLQLDIYHGTANLITSFLELLQPTSGDLLRLVPPDSVSVGSTGLDVDGAIDLFFDLLDEFDPDAAQQVEGSIDAFAEQSGVHPLDDVARLFTGEVVGFARDLATYTEGREHIALEDLVGGTSILGLSDGEAFIDSVEDLLSHLGLDALLDYDEFDGADVYMLDDGSAVLLYAAVTEEFVAICGSEEDMDDVILAFNQEGRASILQSKRFGPMLEELDGTPSFWLSETAASLSNLVAMFHEKVEDLGAEEDDPALELLDECFGSAEALGELFSGLAAFTMDSDDGVSSMRFWTL